MFITIKKHNKILEEYREEILELREKLLKSENLRDVLEELRKDKFNFGKHFVSTGGISGNTINFSDNVAVI